MLKECTPASLRYGNLLATLLTALVAAQCRYLIEARAAEREGKPASQGISAYAFHTGVNIASFPVIFFFSGLYYTDVVSTLVVLVAYRNHLSRVGQRTPGVGNDLWTVVLGVAALFMRQTNVFWVVVYMGGLEAVHVLRSVKLAGQGPLAKLYDPPLNQSGPEGTSPIPSPSLWPLLTNQHRLALLRPHRRLQRALQPPQTPPPNLPAPHHPHPLRRLRSLERRRRPRYLPHHLSPKTHTNMLSRRQIQPHRDPPPPPTPLPLPPPPLLLLPPRLRPRPLQPPGLPHLPPSPPHPPRRPIHNPLRPRHNRRLPGRGKVQHHHPPVHARRQQALHVLCVSVYHPAGGGVEDGACGGVYCGEVGCLAGVGGRGGDGDDGWERGEGAW